MSRFDGQTLVKSPKVCAEYYGIKGKIGCDSSVVEGGAPSLVQVFVCVMFFGVGVLFGVLDLLGLGR